jgi:TIR domain
VAAQKRRTTRVVPAYYSLTRQTRGPLLIWPTNAHEERGEWLPHHLRPSGLSRCFFPNEALRDELAKHLHLLERQGISVGWYDRQISAGSEWAGAIDSHLETAHIILLLVSADFLASKYCYDIEVQRAMERHKAGEAHVIPVILRAVDWHSAPFGTLQALPKDGRPVTSWPNRDEAFLHIALGIRAVAEAAISRPARELHTALQAPTQISTPVQALQTEPPGLIIPEPGKTTYEASLTFITGVTPREQDLFLKSYDCYKALFPRRSA